MMQGNGTTLELRNRHKRDVPLVNGSKVIFDRHFTSLYYISCSNEEE